MSCLTADSSVLGTDKNKVWTSQQNRSGTESGSKLKLKSNTSSYWPGPWSCSLYTEKNHTVCEWSCHSRDTANLDSWHFLHKISILQLHTAQADPHHVYCHCEMQITGLCLRSDLKCQFSWVREEEKSGGLIPSPSCWSTVISRMSSASSAMLFLLVKPGSNTFSDLHSTRLGMLNLIGLILWYTQAKNYYKVLSTILTFPSTMSLFLL